MTRPDFVPIPRQLNWTALAERAATMSDQELRAARAAIIEALPDADALDRKYGTDNGGYYRDEASVYAAEQRERLNRGRCPRCGGRA